MYVSAMNISVFVDEKRIIEIFKLADHHREVGEISTGIIRKLDIIELND